MEDFFGGQGQTVIQNQSYGQGYFQPQNNAQEDDFQFSEPINYVSIENMQKPITESYNLDHQALRRMQEEQMRIQENLREKSNRQYEEKQKRKQQGQRQYQAFMQKKHRQTQQRRQQNKQKQKRLIENNIRLSQEAGWKKVAANVPLKQGEHKGAKDITRMRESIINKKNDQTN